MNEHQIILAIQGLNMLEANTSLVHHLAGSGERAETKLLVREISDAREALVAMLRTRTAANRPTVAA